MLERPAVRLGISFMGSRWDYDVPSVNVFVEVLRVLRPGAHAMFFGGTKTFHRMMVNIEDAGFLPVDLCMWLYGSGFPKSVDISKAIDKQAGHWRGRAGAVSSENSAMGGSNYERSSKGDPVTSDGRRWSGQGTALKPAWEPCGLFVKMFDGTIVENCLKHGTGGLDIEGTRIGAVERFNGAAGNTGESAASVAPVNVSGYAGKTVVGRHPANLVLSHSPECVHLGTRGVRGSVPSGPRWTAPSTSHARGKMNGGLVEGREPGIETVDAYDCVEDCPIRLLDAQGGNRPGMSGGGVHREGYAGGMFGAKDDAATARNDQGGASRFFYNAKVSREERDRGLDDFGEVPKGVGALRDGKRRGMAKNAHPTLKPIDLCRYYARLLLPPPRADGNPRRLLVPYSGAGSEMIGALQAGWDEVVGVELVPKHAEWALARIAKGKIIRNAKK